MGALRSMKAAAVACSMWSQTHLAIAQECVAGGVVCCAQKYNGARNFYNKAAAQCEVPKTQGSCGPNAKVDFGTNQCINLAGAIAGAVARGTTTASVGTTTTTTVDCGQHGKPDSTDPTGCSCDAGWSSNTLAGIHCGVATVVQNQKVAAMGAVVDNRSNSMLPWDQVRNRGLPFIILFTCCTCCCCYAAFRLWRRRRQRRTEQHIVTLNLEPQSYGTQQAHPQENSDEDFLQYQSDCNPTLLCSGGWPGEKINHDIGAANGFAPVELPPPAFHAAEHGPGAAPRSAQFQNGPTQQQCGDGHVVAAGRSRFEYLPTCPPGPDCRRPMHQFGPYIETNFANEPGAYYQPKQYQCAPAFMQDVRIQQPHPGQSNWQPQPQVFEQLPQGQGVPAFGQDVRIQQPHPGQSNWLPQPQVFEQLPRSQGNGRMPGFAHFAHRDPVHACLAKSTAPSANAHANQSFSKGQTASVPMSKPQLAKVQHPLAKSQQGHSPKMQGTQQPKAKGMVQAKGKPKAKPKKRW